ncbi:hypothetical protein B0H13DRAFT_2061905 [Mycena leptocephala]|nr:hypothetical protein B0H13DRAFT_2061905 [Mycena leptocephala]
MLYHYIGFYSMGWACCRGSTVPISSLPGRGTMGWRWRAGANLIHKIFFMIIPGTKGRSLEDMHIIFGSTTQEVSTAHIAARETELDYEFRGDAHLDDEMVHNEQTM